MTCLSVFKVVSQILKVMQAVKYAVNLCQHMAGLTGGDQTATFTGEQVKFD